MMMESPVLSAEEGFVKEEPRVPHRLETIQNECVRRPFGISHRHFYVPRAFECLSELLRESGGVGPVPIIWVLDSHGGFDLVGLASIAYFGEPGYYSMGEGISAQIRLSEEVDGSNAGEVFEPDLLGIGRSGNSQRGKPVVPQRPCVGFTLDEDDISLFFRVRQPVRAKGRELRQQYNAPMGFGRNPTGFSREEKRYYKSYGR